MTTPSGDTSLRRIGRQGLWYAFASVLTRAIGFLMLPVYTRYLSPADYGVLQLVELSFDLLSIIAGARLAAGVFTFYHKAGTDADRRLAVSSAFVLTVGLSVAVGAVAFLLAPTLARVAVGDPGQAGLFRLYAGAFALSLSVTIPMALLRLLERPRAVVGFQLLKTAIQVVLNVVFLASGLGVAGLVLSTLIATGVQALPLWRLLVRHSGFGATGDWLRRHVRYTVPLAASQGASFLLTFGDRYFLNAYANTTVVGLYSLSYQFGFLMTQVGYLPFVTAWEPIRYAIARQPNRDQVFARVFILMNVVLVTTGVGIGLFVTDVLRVMTTPAFHEAGRIVPLILLAYVIQAWNGYQEVGIHFMERTEYITLSTWVSGGVIIAAYFLLIPPLGGLGAALATLIAFSVRWALTYRFSQRLLPLAYRWPPVLRLLLWAAAVVVAGMLLPPLPLVLSLAARTGLLAVYAALVLFGGVLDPADRHLILRHPRAALDAIRQAAGPGRAAR